MVIVIEVEMKVVVQSVMVQTKEDEWYMIAKRSQDFWFE